MGTLSSWAAFALTHHTIVQWAALQAGWQTRFRDYRLLGDDIVIANGAVAERYTALLTKLGVTVNRTKSLHAIGAAEFAKRTFVAGEEFTGLIWPLFSLAANSHTGFFGLIQELRRRCYDVDWTGILQVVLGSPSTKIKVGRPLRNLLLSLSEAGGPVERLDLWWASSGTDTTQSWFDLTACECTIDEETLRAATFCKSAKALSQERLLLKGREILKELSDKIVPVLAAQLEDALARRELQVNRFEYSDVPKTALQEALRAIRTRIPGYTDRMELLVSIHPVREVAEAGLEERPDPVAIEPETMDEYLADRLTRRVTPSSWRVLSKSDSEVLALTRDLMTTACRRHLASKRFPRVGPHNAIAIAGLKPRSTRFIANKESHQRDSRW